MVYVVNAYPIMQEIVKVSVLLTLLVKIFPSSKMVNVSVILLIVIILTKNVFVIVAM